MPALVRLRQSLRTATAAHLLVGAAFGCCFPIGATLWQIVMEGLPLTLASVSLVQRTTWLLWIIDSAPFFLGFSAALAGVRKDRLVQSEIDSRRASHQLSLILDAAGEGIYGLDTEGRVMFVNRSAIRLLGYSDGDDFLNRSAVDFCHPVRADGSPYPQDECPTLAAIRHGSVHISSDDWFRRADGSLFPVDYSSTPLQEGDRITGAVVTFRDISERRRSEEVLRESEERLRTILDSIKAGILLIDAETHRIVDANPAACQMFGSGQEDIVGSACHQYVCPAAEGRCPITDLGQTVDNSERVLLTAGGGQAPILKTVAPVSINGRPHLLESFIDISEQKRAEEDLRRLNENLEQIVEERTAEIRQTLEQLKQAQAQLLQSEKMASIGQLAAGVAHEINNPVGFVSSNLGTLAEYAQGLRQLLEAYGQLESRLSDSDQEGIAAAREAIAGLKDDLGLDFVLEDLDSLVAESREGTQRVRKIVQNLKEFAHVDREEKSLANLNDGLESTLNIVWNELKYKAEVEKSYGELPEIECYPQELNQVFTNILVNASQAIEERGTITIRSFVEDACVCVAIADTGKGMSAEVRERIFEPFFTTKEVGKGTGLGLSMAYNIVHKHDGDIRIDSQEGVGTTFTIAIPIHTGGSTPGPAGE